MIEEQSPLENPKSIVPLSYVIISPVRDEAVFIEKTLRSVTEQTVKPAEWIIVNDGSTDATETIVEPYTQQYNWIRLINRQNRGYRQRGPGVVEAFYEGFEQITCTDYDVVVKLDGDLSFEPAYFEALMEHFRADSQLGIASGQIYVHNGREWATSQALHPCTQGPTKLYRRECFEAIGGIPRSYGWDGIDDWKARMLGWRTNSFENLKVLHYRPEGKATGMLKSRVEQGRGAYFMGYHPLFMATRALRRLVTPPFVVGGLAMLWGYISSWLSGKKQVEPELVRYIRQYQMRMLSQVIKKMFGVKSSHPDEALNQK